MEEGQIGSKITSSDYEKSFCPPEFSEALPILQEVPVSLSVSQELPVSLGILQDDDELLVALAILQDEDELTVALALTWQSHY